MAATVRLQIPFESLVEAIASLDLEEKRQLQDMIDQQIFESEEAFEDDLETQAEAQAARAEYAAGEYLTMDEYLADRSNQAVLAGGKMKVKYDREADILIFVLQEKSPINAIAEPGGIVISYGEDDEPVSIEFLNAAKRQLFNPKEATITIFS